MQVPSYPILCCSLLRWNLEVCLEKGFQKVVKKKFPKIFKHPNSGSNFNARWMRTKNTLHFRRLDLQVLPVTTRTKHPLDKAATWFAQQQTPPKLPLPRSHHHLVTWGDGQCVPFPPGLQPPPNTSDPKRIATFCWSLEGVARFFLDLKKKTS